MLGCMRKVRPTLKLFMKKMLGDMPSATWISEADYRNVRYVVEENTRHGRPKTRGLYLDELRHRMLERAAQLLAGNYQGSRHVSSSKAAGCPVYEVRCMEGAAWRGALVMDEKGDPWLVHADRHDRFDDHAQEYLAEARRNLWWPSKADYVIREVEDQGQQYRAQEIDLLCRIIDALRDATQNIDQQGLGQGEFAFRTTVNDIRVQVTSGGVFAEDPTSAADEEAFVFLTVLIPQWEDNELFDMMSDVAHCLQPSVNPADMQISAQADGSCRFDLILNQARLAQILAATFIDGKSDTDLFQAPGEQPFLHYVDKEAMARSMVTGVAAKALCGVWYVARIDAKTAGDRIPLCPRCQQIKPCYPVIAALLGDEA